MAYHLYGLGSGLSKLLWWKSTESGIDIGTQRGWFFRWLFYRRSAWSPAQAIYVTGLTHVSTCVTGAPTISWYRIPIYRQDN